MNQTLVETIKLLRLPGLATHWEEYLDTARKGRFSPVRLLRHILEEEAKLKRATAHHRRLRQARLPELLAMETFPFDRQPNLDRKKILSIYDAFDYLPTSPGRRLPVHVA